MAANLQCKKFRLSDLEILDPSYPHEVTGEGCGCKSDYSMAYGHFLTCIGQLGAVFMDQKLRYCKYEDQERVTKVVTEIVADQLLMLDKKDVNNDAGGEWENRNA
jgi:hypothetical protein